MTAATTPPPLSTGLSDPRLAITTKQVSELDQLIGELHHRLRAMSAIFDRVSDLADESEGHHLTSDDIHGFDWLLSGANRAVRKLNDLFESDVYNAVVEANFKSDLAAIPRAKVVKGGRE
ncbi:hypothetical protein [Terrihabitans rhizophilus]|uniref:NTP pyrophosphohydrolase MazG putative catalytic core domain-containing protein n=1 Tax=Terrihabitans rhizophilus TaxID=3092662 RepID=A0ABU4RNC5_9HYPH|nr:hypothetical protein [Terrihabitans sp. PJ23]MDX6806344.1 hypothetical protein [Terrihabitans sp. PJ23]